MMPEKQNNLSTEIYILVCLYKSFALIRWLYDMKNGIPSLAVMYKNCINIRNDV